MKLIFATTNQGKILEISEIIALNNYEITIKGLETKLEEPEEHGDTYQKNAEIKFLYYEKHLDIQDGFLFCEDSGIEIEGIEDGVIGVNCAPFMRKFSTQKECFLKLKSMLESKYQSAENVPARFICNICTRIDGTIMHFEGKVDGSVTFKNIDDEGFGYDPIFIPKNFQKTFAKIKSVYKNKISHRAIAFGEFMNYVKNV